jgi:trehalose-6-phosphatase
MTDWKTTMLGKTGWKVGRLGLASSYGAAGRKMFVKNMEKETMEAVRHFHTIAKVARNVRTRTPGVKT